MSKELSPEDLAQVLAASVKLNVETHGFEGEQLEEFMISFLRALSALVPADDEFDGLLRVARLFLFFASGKTRIHIGGQLAGFTSVVLECLLLGVSGEGRKVFVDLYMKNLMEAVRETIERESNG